MTALRPPARIDAADFDRAGVRLPQPDHAFERRGLAGSVRPEQAEDLAVLDLEAHAPRRLDVAVPLVQIVTDGLTILRYADGISPPTR